MLLSDGALPTAPTQAELQVARTLDAATRAFDDVRRQVRAQVNLAVATGQVRVTLRSFLPAGTVQRAVAYRDAVEAMARAGSLLSVAGSPRAHDRVRRGYLDEVIAATD